MVSGGFSWFFIIPNWFSLIPGRFSWFFMSKGWFSWFWVGFLGFSWFFKGPGFFFVVSGRFCGFHGFRSVLHDSRSVLGDS